jgi:hypothetical protein
MSAGPIQKRPCCAPRHMDSDATTLNEMAKEHKALGDPEPWDGMFPGERRIEMEADDDGMIRHGYEDSRFEGESDEDFTSDEQEDAEFIGEGGG